MLVCRADVADDDMPFADDGRRVARGGDPVAAAAIQRCSQGTPDESAGAGDQDAAVRAVYLDHTVRLT